MLTEGLSALSHPAAPPGKPQAGESRGGGMQGAIKASSAQHVGVVPSTPGPLQGLEETCGVQGAPAACRGTCSARRPRSTRWDPAAVRTPAAPAGEGAPAAARPGRAGQGKPRPGKPARGSREVPTGTPARRVLPPDVEERQVPSRADLFRPFPGRRRGGGERRGRPEPIRPPATAAGAEQDQTRRSGFEWLEIPVLGGSSPVEIPSPGCICEAPPPPPLTRREAAAPQP